MKDFCISLFQKEQEDKAVKIYYAECLRIITENTAKMGGGSYITAKLSDIINPKPADMRLANKLHLHNQKETSFIASIFVD